MGGQVKFFLRKAPEVSMGRQNGQTVSFERPNTMPGPANPAFKEEIEDHGSRSVKRV